MDKVCQDDLEGVCYQIHDKLVAGVEKRLVADAKVGFLLSGGLDSSLVCAIAQKKSDVPNKPFANYIDYGTDFSVSFIFSIYKNITFLVLKYLQQICQKS